VKSFCLQFGFTSDKDILPTSVESGNSLLIITQQKQRHSLKSYKNKAANHNLKKIKIYTDSQRTIGIINSPKALDVYGLRREKKTLSIISKMNQPVLQTPYTFELSALKYFMT